TLLSGIMGQKKRIHIHVGDVLESELDEIASKFDNSNRQIQALAQAIDDSVLANYKLWPTNYIAYDLLNNTDKYSHLYTEKEKSLFERRLEIRIDENNPLELQGFLAMYANPVVNKSKYENAV
ncbi:MAG: 1-acyl-sn-glycerol-3-phosphate acyltransferase, partial [Flavobacterium sp.]|nr:1-acyl-sn-glycerol-3-phosphate acyltransferase [Flavobacterium sp.]